MSEKRDIRILLVEDDEEDAMIFSRYARRMQTYKAEMSEAGGIEEANALLENETFDVVFSDLNLGTALSGLDFLREMKLKGCRTPCIIVTGAGDETKAVEAMKGGALDYILKDRLSPDMIERAILSALQRTALERERDEMMRKLEEMSVTDALTGVANRRRLTERVEHEIAVARRSGRPLAFLMLDLDHFKKINDTFGHQRGDEVLCVCAKTFVECVRNIDLVARYGGEEFAVVMPDSDTAGALHAGERIREAVESLKGEGMPTVSVGLVTWESGQAAADLFACADKALYTAKETGRNRVVEYGAAGGASASAEAAQAE